MKRNLSVLIAAIGLLLISISAFAVPTATPTPSIVGIGNTSYSYQKTSIVSTSGGLAVKPLAPQQTVGTYSILSLGTNTTNALCDWFSTNPMPSLPSDNAFEVTPGEWLDDSMPTNFGPAWLGMECWTKAGSTPIIINATWRK